MQCRGRNQDMLIFQNHNQKHNSIERNNEELKEIVDRVKDKLKSGVVLIGANNGNAMFLAGVSKDLTGKIKAGDIVKEVSKIANGNGGGRPDFAQAGGKAGEKVYEALEHGKRYLEEKL